MAVLSQGSIPRYVGVAFLAQFSTSLTAGLLSTAMLSGDVSNVVVAIGADATRLRVVILLELLTSVGIIALTSLLYVALRDTIRWAATLAFALWIAEATVLAATMLSLYALLDLGTSMDAGSALSASDAAIGRAALGLHEHGTDIAMLFFGAGALLWYGLFLRTRFVPRWLSIWGLASVALVFLATLTLVWNRDLQPPILLYIAYVPFEFFVGWWLLVKGSPSRPDPEVTTPASSPLAERSAAEGVDVRPASSGRAVVRRRQPLSGPSRISRTGSGVPVEPWSVLR